MNLEVLISIQNKIIKEVEDYSKLTHQALDILCTGIYRTQITGRVLDMSLVATIIGACITDQFKEDTEILDYINFQSTYEGNVCMTVSFPFSLIKN